MSIKKYLYLSSLAVTATVLLTGCGPDEFYYQTQGLNQGNINKFSTIATPKESMNCTIHSVKPHHLSFHKGYQYGLYDISGDSLLDNFTFPEGSVGLSTGASFGGSKWELILLYKQDGYNLTDEYAAVISLVADKNGHDNYLLALPGKMECVSTSGTPLAEPYFKFISK